MTSTLNISRAEVYWSNMNRHSDIWIYDITTTGMNTASFLLWRKYNGF